MIYCIAKISKTISYYHSNLPWWLSWLDSGVLINVDVPGCSMSVVRGLKWHKRKVFILEYSCTEKLLC